MVRKILVLSVLAMSLATPSAYAQTAPASAVDPASIRPSRTWVRSFRH